MIRRLFFWALIIVFIWVVIREFDQIKLFVGTLAQGKLGWVLLAVGLVVLYNLVVALTYQLSFATADVHLRLSTLIPLELASMFVGAVAPGGATAGMALYVDDIVRRGYSAARAAAGLVIQMIADFTSLAIVMGVGLIVMQIRGEVNIFTVLSVGIILGITVCLIGVMLVGLWRPGLLRRLFRFFQLLVNAPAVWLKQPSFLQEGWAEESSEEFIEAASAMVHNPGRMLFATVLMLANNIVDIAILKVLFISFGYNIGFGTVLAGFSMNNLAMILSPAPQGIGVVEGALVYAFDSLGVPWEINLTTTLAYRGLTFWLPLIIGVFLLRRLKTFQIETKTPVPGDSIPWLAALMAILGALNILAVIAPPVPGQAALLESYSPFYIPSGFTLTAIASGVILFVLALGLFRRKRLIWLVSLIVVIGVIIAHVYMGGAKDQQAILGAGIGVWLLFLTPHFKIRSDPKAVRLGLYGLAGGLALVLVFWAAELLQPDILYLIGSAALAFFLMMVERPVQLHQPASAKERKRARQIVEAHARSSMASLALLDDKHYYFSPEDSLVAYTVRGRAAVSLGDPIGAKGETTEIIASFSEFCKQNDWIPVFCQTLPEHQESYQNNGFRSICLGDEAVVDLRNFTLEGQASRSTSEHYERFISQRYQVIFHQPPLSDELMVSLREASCDWPEIPFGTEKFLTLDRFEDAYVQNCPLATVLDAEGRVCAFANLFSEKQLNQVVVDLVRHHKEIPPGLMDFLFVALLLWAKEQGYEGLNLGLSALIGTGGRPGETKTERLSRWMVEKLNPSFNYKGLRDFKARFDPGWSPQYLTLRSLTHLPVVLITMALVNPGGRGAWWGNPRRRVNSSTEERVWLDGFG